MRDSASDNPTAALANTLAPAAAPASESGSGSSRVTSGFESAGALSARNMWYSFSHDSVGSSSEWSWSKSTTLVDVRADERADFCSVASGFTAEVSASAAVAADVNRNTSPTSAAVPQGLADHTRLFNSRHDHTMPFSTRIQDVNAC